MDGDGDGDKEGDGQVDVEGTETCPSLGMETRPSLLVGDVSGNQSSAFSAIRSPRPESASPQLGADGFCRLTFGNDPLTRML